MTAAAADLGPIPAELAAEYPDAIAALTQYAELLATTGVERGLIGPREVPRIWERHIANCALVEQVIAEGSHVADVGSGAGLPGLVLALVRPDLRITLIEPLLRRATFLTEAVESLGLTDRVIVLRARAEDLTPAAQAEHQLPADVVTARAVANLSQLFEWCWPLVRLGGKFAVLKGESAAEEVDQARPAIAKYGLATDAARVTTVTGADTQATLVVIDRPDRQG